MPPIGKLLRWLERPRNRWVIHIWFPAYSRNPMGIDRDPLLLVSLSEPMELRETPGEVEVRGENNANASEEPPAN